MTSLNDTRCRDGYDSDAAGGDATTGAGEPARGDDAGAGASAALARVALDAKAATDVAVAAATRARVKSARWDLMVFSASVNFFVKLSTLRVNDAWADFINPSSSCCTSLVSLRSFTCAVNAATSCTRRPTKRVHTPRQFTTTAAPRSHRQSQRTSSNASRCPAEACARSSSTMCVSLASSSC